MNLAQLIDPEWVQRGAQVRHAPMRPQEPDLAAEAAALVNRRGPAPKRKLEVLGLMAGRGVGFSAAQVADELGLDQSQTSFLLSTLKSEARIEAVNPGRRPSVYTITAAGHALLAAYRAQGA